MDLTRNQVMSIENRLQHNGLTYWDIRIEVLDHLVTMIEEKMSKGESYDSAVENTFHTLDYSGNLFDLNRRWLFGINKIVRRQYFNQVKTFFTNPVYLISLLLCLAVYSFIFLKTSVTVFKVTSGILLMAPIIYGVFFHLKVFFQKQKSGFLVYSSFYIFFSFMVLNIFIQFFKPDGIFVVEPAIEHKIWFSVIIINGIFSTAGIMIHQKTRKRIKSMELKLKCL